MGIGGSIFLIAIGAIVAFGVRDQTFGPFDLNVIGWVLMIAGFLGLILTMYLWSSRRRRIVTEAPPVVEQPVRQYPPRETVVDEETRTRERRY
jgi:Domain of unknown function (DUF6458)